MASEKVHVSTMPARAWCAVSSVGQFRVPISSGSRARRLAAVGILTKGPESGHLSSNPGAGAHGRGGAERRRLEYARHGRLLGGESPLEEEVVLTPSRRQLRRREAGWEGSPRDRRVGVM